MKKLELVVLVQVFVLSCLFLLLSTTSMSMPAPAVAHNQSESADVSTEAMPDLVITAIKPYHYEWSEEHEMAKGDPWFNLMNYVEVTVVNIGNETAGCFGVKLYANDELIGSETADNLPAYSEDYPKDNTTSVTFKWMPEGDDPLSWTDSPEGAICTYTDTSREYTLRAVVDADGEVSEENEDNNEFTKQEPQKVVWNGFMADEPLENYLHGEVNGGIIYTTGDGEYIGCSMDGTKYGTYYVVNYDLEIPGNVKLARLYIYHTWSKPEYTAPKIGVTFKTPSNEVYNLELYRSYNDIKGDFGAWRYVWGTYAYDISAEYVKESGTYVVTARNLNDGSDTDFATAYALAAPAILLVYEDTTATAPRREYWINEGADVLIGGRRGEGGFLSLEECKNTATFSGSGSSIDLSEVEKATLAVVSVWGADEPDNVLYFNDNKLGEGVYSGYHGPYSSDVAIEGISMTIGGSAAQVGIAAFDVTNELERRDNRVIQGDDGDNMMPANAFLVVTYKEEEEYEEQVDESGGTDTFAHISMVAWDPVESVVNNTEGESRTFFISVDQPQPVDMIWQINGTEVQRNESVTEASYTSTSAMIGTWNVSAIATNRETGLSGMHRWIWNVTTAPATTPTPAVNITATPSPTPSNMSTPAPVPTVKPTTTPASTPTPTEGEQKSEADEAPVPGFGLALALFMLIVVAYLLRKGAR